jgi:pimeloyl-ACP methyl ester carboxylesterase
MGIGGSMLWWEEGFCRKLAKAGRFVIRYDHRDTGRSVTYQPGAPEYTGTDVMLDAIGVLDAYGIAAAHLVGVSAGAAMAQLAALRFPERVRSLVLISTTNALTGGSGLPPPTEQFTRFAAAAEVDWADAASVREYLVGYSRLLAGGQRPFDEAPVRALVQREIDRAHDFSAAQNHDIVVGQGEPPSGSLSSITAPTLVVHGSADPMFPLEHGEALAEEIPNATLVTLDGAGHGIARTDWETIVGAIADHTALADHAAPRVSEARET